MTHPGRIRLRWSWFVASHRAYLRQCRRTGQPPYNGSTWYFLSTLVQFMAHK
jgi:hypothetical protein